MKQFFRSVFPVVLGLWINTGNLYAQRETSVWMFSTGKGLDFNHDPPTQIASARGMGNYQKTTICDKDGNLLFITDGFMVVNSALQMMQNGDLLDYNDQAPVYVQNNTMIAPMPGNPLKYYVISCHASASFPELNDDGNWQTLHYSVVDLGENHGLGKVISKNNIISHEIYNFIITGDLRSGNLYLVSQDINGSLKSYRISSGGFEKTGELNIPAYGGYELKSTPNGKILISASGPDGNYGITLYDFNIFTGEISNFRQVRMFSWDEESGMGSFELSSNSRFVYRLYSRYIYDNHHWITGANQFLYRYDLAAGSAENIEKSRFLVHEFPVQDIWINNLQLDWKGEIVLNNSNNEYLSLIPHPNDENDPGFIFDAIPIVGLFTYQLPFYPEIYFSECLSVQYPPFAGSDISICSGVDGIIGSPPVNGYNYMWYPSAYLSNPQASRTLIHLAPGDLSVPDTLFYFSEMINPEISCSMVDTIVVTAYPSFSRKITGPYSVCPGSDSLVYTTDITSTDISYQWNITGGSFQGNDTSSSALIHWQKEPGEGRVDLKIENIFGCSESVNPFFVKISDVLNPETPRGEDTLDCLTHFYNYEVTAKHGSVYLWNELHGNIMNGEGSNKVRVQWEDDQVNGKLWVEETVMNPGLSCHGISDTITIINRKAYGDENLHIDRISSDIMDSTVLVFNYHIDNPGFFSEEFQIRRGRENDWDQIWYLDNLENEIKLNDPLKNSGMYDYQLRAFNLCNLEAFSRIHNNIFLEAVPVGDSSAIDLSWNDDSGWNGHPVQYKVFRKLDNESSYSLVATTSETEIRLLTLGDGFQHRFYLSAENMDTHLISLSNTTGFEYIQKVGIPNIFTPNGDGFNDFFEILNIGYYPENILSVINRYGQEVYHANPYLNRWDGGSLPPGIYYYWFKTKKYEQVTMGWLELRR